MPSPEPQNVALFGKSVIAGVIKIKSYWSRLWVLNPMLLLAVQEENSPELPGRMPHDDGSGDYSNACASQGCQGPAATMEHALPHSPQQEPPCSHCADTLTLDF